MKRSRADSLSDCVEVICAVEKTLSEVQCDIQEEIDVLFEENEESLRAFLLWDNLCNIDDILDITESCRSEIEKVKSRLNMIKSV